MPGTALQSPRPAGVPFLGIGVGLRPKHYPRILGESDPKALGVDFFEALSENYMVPGGRPLRVLSDVRARFPLALHGVSLNIGSADPLCERYIAELKALAQRFEPAIVSDHLCWTGVHGRNLHDLVPLPYTEATLCYVAERVRRVQDQLGRRLALENVSSYFAYTADAMPEWEFLAGIAERADCGILLDVNNIFVSAHNHGFDPLAYLSAIPPQRVVQIHLAGHSEAGELLIDTHDHPVREEVWSLYEAALRQMGPVSTIIEWDDRIPEFHELAREAARARAILRRVEGERERERPARGARARPAPAPAVSPH
jgi:uncharacterized protein (UPF0276 family)